MRECSLSRPLRLLIVGLVLVLAGCGQDAPPSVGSSPTPAAMDEAETAIVALLNSYRTGAALPALVRDASLDDVARDWSAHLALVGTPSHNPSYSAQIPAGWAASGENIGWADPAVHPLDLLPAALQQAWLDSPSHRANLDSTAYTAVGVGVTYSEETGIYVTADFAAYP